MPVLTMNAGADASAWSQTEQYSAIAPLAEEDFANFLDLTDIDLSFPIYAADEDHGLNSHQQHAVSADADVEMQNGLPETRPQHMYKQGENGMLAAGIVHQQQPLHVATKVPGVQVHGNGNGIIHPFYRSVYEQQHQAQQHPHPHPHHQAAHQQHEQLPQQVSYAGMQDRRFIPQSAIPPTPTSLEMRGDIPRAIPQLETHPRLNLEQRYNPRKDEIDFTPLVSPAVTPQEASVQIPAEFAVPGSYFSPLASPALIAQNQAGRRSYRQHSQALDSPSTASPVDMDMDMHGLRRVETEPARKIRKKASVPRSVASSATVRQSPVTKPSKRKTSLNTVIPPKEVADLFEGLQRSSGSPSQPSANLLSLPHGHDSSEAESISPEPLSETLMGPPPKPASATQSPAIPAQNQTSIDTLHANSGEVCPATPASIMRLTQAQKANQSGPGSSARVNGRGATSDFVSQAPMEELTLPEAATPSKSPLSLTITTGTGASTPRLSSRKKPQLGLLDPQSAGVASPIKSSPSTSAMTSPTVATAAAKKAELKSGRAVKKRNSTGGSALVSPALRPKISPSIKPLLPESISDETHALLLASKSNYQNILEGTHVPGVTYPEALSNNLTSKRTSHKIAEQGRRNRINTALQEMQSLLPSAAALAKNGTGAAGSPEDGTPPQQANSKAATVESAIDYIKLLQREAREKNMELESRDKELAELRVKLNEAEKQLGGMSADSDVQEG